MTRRLLVAFALLVLLILLAGTAGFLHIQAKVNEPAELLQPAGRTSSHLLITRVRVFDDATGQLKPASAVEIHDGRIAHVHWSGDSVPTDFDGHILAGEDRTLVPGLIDFHVHYGSSDGRPPWAMDGPSLISVAAQREAFLYSGVTSTVEGSPNALANLDRQQGPAPRIFSASRMITALDGHPVPMFREFVPWPLTDSVIAEQVMPIRSAVSDRAAIEALVAGASHHIKLVFDAAIPWDSPRLTDADIRQVVTLAHGAGKPVYVHVGTAQEAVVAAEAGADVLMHTPYVDRFSDAQLQRLKRSGAAVVTTGQIWEWYERGLNKTATLTPLEQRLASDAMVGAWQQDWHAALTDYDSTTFSDDYRARIPGFAANQAYNLKQLYRAGIPQLAGTDFGIPGLTPGASLIRELSLLQSYGYQPVDLLRMATSAPGARLADAGAPLGVVQGGAVADLLLVNGDPTADIGALADLTYVIREGVVYRR
ncbi:amidohydrolase family protein [Marinobacter sp. SS21]|uniref:amidohydrolase family protein n=1 Tax=Marinobacter sp. SS21 TaxID=2979460 RepID=UPI00232BCEC8|nr:amidohydrolase family protein [Marinobacter sp. SS21]MDC0661191.1 amidohydrolase family protein [Marinobacter sp. SS21]